MKELPMMMGGDSIDYSRLTAQAEHVREGDFFIGSGSEEEQVGKLLDMSKERTSPTIEGTNIPIHEADDVRVMKDNTGETRVALSPARGEYPGGEGAYVGTRPEALGITPNVIPNNMKVCGVIGKYGADADARPEDLREGKTAINADGVMDGTGRDYGNISKTLRAGESYDIEKGFYGPGQVRAADLASQTEGNAEAGHLSKGKTATVNGKQVTGTLEERGQYQYGGIGSGTDYYAINGLPEGIYRSGGQTWAPEARIKQQTLREFLGVSEGKIIKNETIAGINGTGDVKFGSKIDVQAQCMSYTASELGPVQASFTMPKNGYVICGGIAVCDRTSGRYVRCEIYKNGTLIDNRNCDSSNSYVIRGTMMNRVIAANAGDTIMILAQVSGNTDQVSQVWALPVYV